MRTFIRVLMTLVLAAVAIALGVWLWNYYMTTPWTRDARVRADVVTVAPDISGWVSGLSVHDNQFVNAGDVLFTINRERYQASFDQAQARLDNQQYNYELNLNDYQRRQHLGANAISDEALETARLNAQIAKAQRDLARAQLESARIDLQRSEVKAPVDGAIVNLQLREGNYVSQGQAQLSIVRQGSFYITAYFEETKIPAIDIGDEASVWLMGNNEEMHGHVAGIGRGIANNNTTPNGEMLPQVQQTFTWVRLSQRIPVDIVLDHVPDDVFLSAGMTASVRIEDADGQDGNAENQPGGMGTGSEQAGQPRLHPGRTPGERQDG
ncbi:efflux RND transporter periplasmic adaptor subunit [Kushneria aurantia]|uniref:Efflux RND transporter periplasmic adaptor subunit n=1 Tax=Kushneria aurantia TaxID=504092 RepID=A0ABV6G1A4_9GAMM|nr:HlyD family secretion protein [Kushneria aurantia]